MRVLLSKKIDEIEFSVRAFNTLRSLDINKLEILVQKTEDELGKSKHVNELVVKEIKGRLDELHLSLGLK